MTEPDEALTLRMFAAVPGLRTEMDAYLRTYVGDWGGPPADVDHLPGFLVKMALDYRRRGAEQREVLRQLLDFLESELGRDEEIDALIELFFAAYLPEPAEPSGAILGLLGPKLWEARENQLLDDGAGVLESVEEFLLRMADEFPDFHVRIDQQLHSRRRSRMADAVLAGLATDAVELVALGRWTQVLPLLEFLELEYGENPAIDNAIDVSFLELLPGPGERGHEIVRMLGPHLAEQRRRTDPPAGHPGAER